jgi:anti-sigma regulatory factor (Ser/Thr protein kinase)
MSGAGESGRSEDPPTLRMTLERDPQAPSLARAAVTGFSKQRKMSPASLSTLALLVSELVSNAVVHSDAPASSGIQLCARLLGPAAVRVEVTDQGSGFDAVPRDPARVEGGYGLYLVDTQATKWGIDRRCGTCVWFEVADDGRRAS